MQRGRTAICRPATQVPEVRAGPHQLPVPHGPCFRLVPALRPVATDIMGNAAPDRSRRRFYCISGMIHSARRCFMPSPKPPPHRVGIGPVGAVRASAGRKSILANPTLHRSLSSAHGAANGVQPHQHERLPVHPPPYRSLDGIASRLPARTHPVDTCPASPGQRRLRSGVHGPRLLASADTARHPGHLRNVIVQRQLLRLLRALHASFLPVSRHLDRV